MDTEFVVLALIFILIGAVGIIAFTGPMTPAGDSCYCLIPSPEPGAGQGTSAIILAIGILFLPMGILKGGLSLRKQGVPQKIQLPSGKVYTPLQIASGKLFGIGLLLTIAGVDALLIPSYLVLYNLAFSVGGTVLLIIGLICVYYGLKPAESK
jgi:hypothetical protein